MKSAFSNLIVAPWRCRAWRAGVIQCASAEIGFKQRHVGSVNIPVTAKIALTGVPAAAGPQECTSAEIRFENYCIGAVHPIVAIEIALAITGITACVPAGWIVVFLTGIMMRGAII